MFNLIVWSRGFLKKLDGGHWVDGGEGGEGGDGGDGGGGGDGGEQVTY